MTDVQEFCLRWNNHQSNLVSAFYDLKLGEDFVDVTLACEGRCLQAHKVVLSACSPFFRDILKTTPCKHPVIVLKDILWNDLVSLIEFIYMGEVRVKHQGLSSFLATAEILRVRGLTETSSKHKTSLLASAEHAVIPARPNDPSFPLLSAQTCDESTQATTPFTPSNGFISDAGTSSVITSVAAATNTSSTEIKVEEIDLDSADDDEDDAEDSQRGQVEADGSRGQLDSHHRGGSLTFQSFARIPALAPLGTSNPLEFPPITEEPNLNSNDAPAMEVDGNAGRAPGRLSSSDRPRWPCPFCMRLLSSRSSVRRHIEDRHTSDTSRHPCPLCERLYRTRNSLQYHLSTAHRDREPGPRGRPRTRPRTPCSSGPAVSTAESAILPVDEGGSSGAKSVIDPADVGSRNNNDNPSAVLQYSFNHRGPPPYGPAPI